MALKHKFIAVIKKRFLHEVGYVSLGSLVNGASLFVVNVLLGRFLLQTEYGVFSVAILSLSTVAELSDLGLNAGLLRFAPFYIAEQEFGKLKHLVKTIWQWRVALTMALTVSGIVSSPYLAQGIFGQPQIAGQIAFAFLGVGGVIMLGFVTTYLQASEQFLRVAVIQSLKGLLRLGLVAALLASSVRNVYWFIGVYGLIPWMLFAAQIHHLPEGFLRHALPVDTARAMNRQLRNFSLWLTIWSILSIISSRIDQAMVSKFLGLKDVALYGVAYQLIQFFPIIAQSITSVLTPKVNRIQNKSELIHLIKRTLRWIVPATVVFVLCVWPSQFIIHLLFGATYDAAMPVYLVLATSFACNFLAVPFSLIIMAFNKTSVATISGVLQLAVNFFGNLLLIPRFGIMGAAYTFALGIAAALLYNVVCSLFILARKEIHVV